MKHKTTQHTLDQLRTLNRYANQQSYQFGCNSKEADNARLLLLGEWTASPQDVRWTFVVDDMLHQGGLRREDVA